MLTLGHYLPSETPLHRLDPRVKIAATLLISLVIFRADGPQIILISAFFAFLIGAAGIPVRHIGRALRPVAPFLALLFGMHLFVVEGNSPGSLSPLPIAITSEGGRQGAYVVWQFAGLVISGALLTMTTSSFGIVQGIERLLRPASRFGVPSSEIAMMIAMAMRFFPLLTEEYERIRMAQLSRGADSGSGSLIRRFRAAANLTLPLLLAAFRRADALIMAMEARGYHRGPRTSLAELRLTAKDGIALTVMSVLILADIGLGMLPPLG
jgi:energy-coupling factor transport system permease protein